MESRIAHHLEKIAQSFESSEVKISLPLKMKTSELILRLVASRKSFGLFVVLGWQNKWNKYIVFPDSRQDIFAGRRIDISRGELSDRQNFGVGATVNFDGAILISRRGKVVHSGVIIEGLRPGAVADKINPGQFPDLSEQYGFRMKVHARHLTAIASSYVFRDTTVFTVSEESGAFHIFERGRIAHRIFGPIFGEEE